MRRKQKELILILIRGGHRAKEAGLIKRNSESGVSKFLKKFHETKGEKRRRQYYGQPRKITKCGVNFFG